MDILPVCDKCGQLVPLDNSVNHLEFRFFNNKHAAKATIDRHLYQVLSLGGFDGCEGSPSRVKLLKTFDIHYKIDTSLPPVLPLAI